LLTGAKPPDALARAAALANGKADPLVRADQLQSIIGAELSAVLEKALALNSSDRFQTAKMFREALRAMGRSESRHQSASGESTNASRTSGFDPFDSYSILKPDQMIMLSAKRSWSIPTAICGVAVLLALAFIASSFVASAVDSDRSVSDYIKATAARSSNANSNPRESHAEKPRAIANASPIPLATQDAPHAGDKQKRNGKRSNARPSEPPTPSLGPALRLPAQ